MGLHPWNGAIRELRYELTEATGCGINPVILIPTPSLSLVFLISTEPVCTATVLPPLCWLNNPLLPAP